MFKRILLIVILIVILVSSYFLFLKPKQNTSTKVEENTYTVQRGDLLLSVSGSGILEPSENMNIVSKVGGTIIFIIDEGKRVKKGDILAKIDPYDYQLAYSQAQLNYNTAKLRYEQAIMTLENQKKQSQQDLKNAQVNRDNAYMEYQRLKKQYENSQSLYKIGAISLDQLESDRNNYEKARNNYEQAELNLETVKLTSSSKVKQAEKDLESAKISLEQAKLNLENARNNLSNTVIKAPFSGIVTNVSAKIGQQVSSNFTLLSLIDIKEVELNLEIDETEIGKVKLGLPVRVNLDAFPDEEFEGKVIKISPTARLVNNIAIFDVRVNLPNPDEKLKPGMTADAEIILLERKNVLLIPLRAVKKVGRRNYVEVLNNEGKKDLVRVTLGEDDGTNVVVEDGLEVGMKVVLPTTATTSTQRTQQPQFNPLRGIFR
jgi:HlyD family secretion protein